MTDTRKKIASAIAAGAMLLNLAAPVVASETGGTWTFTVQGNGADSYNELKFESENETKVTQQNYADVENKIEAKASTGDNEANRNTGGTVEVETGDATTEVGVSNTLNANTAKVENCCVGNVDAKISGNGVDSHNELDLELENEVKVEQWNEANVKNDIEAESETGDNEAKDNTGGSVSISTGNAKAKVAVANAGNSNSAWVTGDGGGTSLSAMIADNGADSWNEIDLELENETELSQGNFADILNEVEADADTGDNEAEDNTGGPVEIETGDAEVDVTVDNMVNFNWADIDGCGCIEDLLAKISGNGVDSHNEIKAELETELEADQYNDFDCSGRDACSDVEADAKTGKNEAKDNTVGDDEDPAVETGDASSSVDVENAGNSNVYGEGEPEDLWEGFDFNFNFSFDLEDLLEALLG